MSYKEELDRIKDLITHMDPVLYKEELELIEERGYDEDYPPEPGYEDEPDEWEEDEDYEEDYDDGVYDEANPW